MIHKPNMRTFLLPLLLALTAAVTAQANKAELADSNNRALLAQRRELLTHFNRRGLDALPAITAALADDAPLLRRTAAHLLVRLGRPALPALEIALTNPDFQVRRIVMDGLSGLGLLAEYWSTILKDPHPSIQRDIERYYLAHYPPGEKVDITLLDTEGTQWTIPAGTEKLSVLAVGGGGAGAPGLGGAGGGGGGGGLVYVDDYLSAYRAAPGDRIDIRVGAGGGTARYRGLPGGDTVFGTITALGGGGGGRANVDDHRATAGGSGGGGELDADGTPAAALQPAESGIGIGFGHPSGGGAGGAGGGGAGGPGTTRGKGGGGIGLQGVPLEQYLNPETGFVTDDFEADNHLHHAALFYERFGLQYGDFGWFAGGGAHNHRGHSDQGGRGGGSLEDGMPHTGGGGGGGTHNESAACIGGSGIVLIRCQHADGTLSIQGWGHKNVDTP